jgi:hypothetical protein
MSGAWTRGQQGTAAVQLGHTELAVRLGGVYALERIAVDSERDHPTVVEVLSAFVREESRKKAAARAGQGTAQLAADTDTPAPESDASPRPATDIQAALTVLGRLPQRPEIPRADLSEAQLSGAGLAEADLSGARLPGKSVPRLARGGEPVRRRVYETNLSGAELWAADLRDTGGLMQAQLDAAHGSAGTRLPDELRRPDGWTA